jgi:hypothetical protein
MKLSTIILYAAPWALIAPLTAAEPGVSAVLPPHGATTYVAEVVGRIIDVAELGKGETETLVEVTGVTRNMLGQSAFDQMKAHCLISFTAGGGRSSAVGPVGRPTVTATFCSRASTARRASCSAGPASTPG